jgi:hypothetical protein
MQWLRTDLPQISNRQSRKKEALFAYFLTIRENLDLLFLKDRPEYQELLRKLRVPLPS